MHARAHNARALLALKPYCPACAASHSIPAACATKRFRQGRKPAMSAWRQLYMCMTQALHWYLHRIARSNCLLCVHTACLHARAAGFTALLAPQGAQRSPPARACAAGSAAVSATLAHHLGLDLRTGLCRSGPLPKPMPPISFAPPRKDLHAASATQHSLRGHMSGVTHAQVRTRGKSGRCSAQGVMLRVKC